MRSKHSYVQHGRLAGSRESGSGSRKQGAEEAVESSGAARAVAVAKAMATAQCLQYVHLRQLPAPE